MLFLGLFLSHLPQLLIKNTLVKSTMGNSIANARVRKIEGAVKRQIGFVAQKAKRQKFFVNKIASEFYITDAAAYV